ncbi:hypothetical protein IGI04_022479 [Brassica rapa subsp. trilocularis]|uniref:Zinc knuckle CX2CX4HX4C domain-containing protein n=1 Tax=Brassica rapa subsp. trilocularis TaxID=1813537 RepID=A0ABQ7M3K1_BRACM|nr:hypothetical protein IGI04_022479 [Brassica rapa subsp. trilocularis]
MDIELPTDDIIEVEFEYIKIEKHCFTCFSLFHEEVECPQRAHNAPPPKDRILGITQSIALQRIEAEKRRHDDRRGYRRPEDFRSTTRTHATNYSQTGRVRSTAERYQHRDADYRRDQSILSRTARSNSGYRRADEPTMQYRRVEKSRLSSGSSVPHNGPSNRPTGDEITGNIPVMQQVVNQHGGSQMDFTPTRNLRDRLSAPGDEVMPQAPIPLLEVTPARNLQSRIEVPPANREGTHSGSRERRSALERIAEPTSRKPPSFESGRLQIAEDLVGGEDHPDHESGEEQDREPVRVPAALRFSDNTAVSSRRVGHSIPLAPQSKSVGKRKVSARKRISRSPLQTLIQRKPTATRSTTSTRRKLAERNHKVVKRTTGAEQHNHQTKSGSSGCCSL